MKTQSFIRKGFFILTALCLSMGGAIVSGR